MYLEDYFRVKIQRHQPILNICRPIHDIVSRMVKLESFFTDDIKKHPFHVVLGRINLPNLSNDQVRTKLLQEGENVATFKIKDQKVDHVSHILNYMIVIFGDPRTLEDHVIAHIMLINPY